MTLSSALTAVQTPPPALSFLSESHFRPGVLRGRTDPSLLRDELLPEVFAASAAAHAERTAIVFDGRRVAYGELERRANRVAQALRARGIGRGSFVGLWMARSLDLHVALLGILKAGAAYLPFDADAPADRVAVSLADCGAAAILVDVATGSKAADLGVEALYLYDLTAGADRADAGAEPNGAPDLRADGVSPDDPAYAIYTSGSTGKPKGIVISHRNICHYLRAANTVYGLTADDVVFQGASVAFDLSLEEIFVPYLVGATLWVASRQVLDSADRLADVLTDAGVTVLDTVPTLLAMLSKDVPGLRVIILGGEACPPAVAARWCRPGRTLFNSYGPTEATVVATVSEVRPDSPVTIGRPIPNYTCYVVDESLSPVPPGTQGELLIGGPGVARGYLGRPELTAEKFIANPFATPFGGDGGDPVLYRSGDAVSVDDAGNLMFHGRIDDQVKIRGFRLELGEIEAALAELPGVAQATVVLRTDNGLDRLVAFLVAREGASLDRTVLRDALRARLPAYMVPAHFEVVESLPRLASGKADRKTLRAAALTQDAGAGAQEEPRTPTEAVLLDAAKRVFPGQTIPLEADFFLDLGGHSLLAAQFLSHVRATAHLEGLTFQDVYGARTLRAMAERLDTRAGAVKRDQSFTPPPLLCRFLCGLAQAAVLPIILALMTAQWLGVFVSYMLLSGEDATFFQEVTTLIGVYIGINVATVAIAVSAKWLIIGRTRPGRYPLWGVYYFRWWLVQRLISLVHLKWFHSSPLMRVLLRALGARVGRDALVGEIESGAIDLVSIGAGTAIGDKVKLANAEVIGNELVIGTIEIGADAYIGTSCVIGHGAVVGDGTELADLTALPAGARTGSYEVWNGSPARCTGTVPRDELPTPPTAGALTKAAQAVLYTLAVLALPPISLIPIFPAFYLFDKLDSVLGDLLGVSYLTYLPVIAWPTAMAMVAVTVLLIAALRWTVLPRVRAGTVSVHSWFYARKWVVALATEVMLETLSSLYATVYMRAWYRLMGAKIGKGAEISANLAGRYDLVDIGEKCFIADEVVLGDEEIRRGWMTLKPVKTEARVFVGNDAVVPAGAVIPAGSLIGIKSKPPSNEEMSPGCTWFGSPPIKLPVRQTFDVSSNWTYEPSRTRRIGRAVFEAFSLSMPTALFITFGTLAVEVLAPSILAADYASFLMLFVAASVAIPAAMVAVVILVKWALMGRYAPTMKPMWSWWAMKTEAVAVLYWGLAGKVLLDHLRGTPMLPWVLRLFGTKFGRGVFMDTTDLTEFDCVEVGDYVALNALSALQTHLYEDRVMKVGRVVVGDGVTVGAGATVLYDTHIGDWARLGPLTLVMKGESIPAHTEWVGAPAEQAADPSATPATLRAAA